MILGGFGPLLLFGFFNKPLIVVVYAVAVGAKHNAFLDFFHSALECTVFYQLVDRGFFGVAVYVVEIKRGRVVLPALYAG